MNPVTSSTAIGSFIPDSPSSARARRRFRLEPRSTAKIAALSVAAIGGADDQPLERGQVEEPGGRDARRSAPSAACRRSPSRAPVFSTGRISIQPAVSPPSKRIRTQADRAQGPGQLDVVEVDAADSVAADEHPEAEEEHQTRDPHPVGDQRGGDPRSEQQTADQDQLCVGQGEPPRSAPMWHPTSCSRRRRVSIPT